MSNPNEGSNSVADRTATNPLDNQKTLQSDDLAGLDDESVQVLQIVMDYNQYRIRENNFVENVANPNLTVSMQGVEMLMKLSQSMLSVIMRPTESTRQNQAKGKSRRSLTCSFILSNSRES
jgi:hypothetical protein